MRPGSKRLSAGTSSGPFSGTSCAGAAGGSASTSARAAAARRRLEDDARTELQLAHRDRRVRDGPGGLEIVHVVVRQAEVRVVEGIEGLDAQLEARLRPHCQLLLEVQ